MAVVAAASLSARLYGPGNALCVACDAAGTTCNHPVSGLLDRAAAIYDQHAEIVR